MLFRWKHQRYNGKTLILFEKTDEAKAVKRMYKYGVKFIQATGDRLLSGGDVYDVYMEIKPNNTRDSVLFQNAAKKAMNVLKLYSKS